MASNGGYLHADAEGAHVFGKSDGENSVMHASNNGATAIGFVENGGDFEATGNGSLVGGYANGETVTATGAGEFKWSGPGSFTGEFTPTGGIALSATNTLTVTSTGVTNGTSNTYLVSVTAGTGLTLKDSNGVQFLTPVSGSTFPLKPQWRFAGTGVTGLAVIISK